MERRRKALGLRKVYSNDEETARTTPRKKSTSANITNEPEAGKRYESHQKGSVTPRNGKLLKDITVPRSNVTPKQTTPKSHQNLSLLKAESPASPLISPSQHAMVIHKMFRSPEVEVSWDWGCSQVVNEIVPKRRLTRASQSQPVPVPDSVSLSYPRLPPNKQMSEEENQERLAFYKNILSKSLKRNQIESNKNNNNIDIENKADSNLNNTTPKRSHSHKTDSTKKDPVNAFFDDSANEFMLECSQAIEEQLKNGEICIGPVINIEIGSKKHPHSPAEEAVNAVKKVCHGKTKQNLFPESTKPAINNHNKKQHISLKSPKVKPSTINLNCGETSLNSNNTSNTVKNGNDVLFTRPTQTSRPPVVKNFFENGISNVSENERIPVKSTASKNQDVRVPRLNSKTECASSEKTGSVISKENSSNKEAKRLLQSDKFVTSKNYTNMNTNGNGNTLHYDSVNKFRRNQKGDISKNPLNLHESNSVVRKSVATADSACKASVKEDCSTNNGLTNVSSVGLVKVTKPKGVDVTPLLDDGFDMDLCSLDFDSLCCNSQPRQSKESQRQAVVESMPKLCSEQEIEAKRLAALKRLMMKKKK